MLTNSSYYWILDPGHGGLLNNVYQTSGKRSPIWSDGSVYYEGVGNREIAKKVGDKLEALDIDYTYTVVPEDPTDVSLTSRINFVNRIPLGNKILVSIHSNAASSPSAEGWEIFTSPGQTKSDTVANVFFSKFQEEFVGSKFRSDKADGDPDKENPLFITTKSACPAILIENFFMTNENECKNILMSESGQDRIVDAIVSSILAVEKMRI